MRFCLTSANTRERTSTDEKTAAQSPELRAHSAYLCGILALGVEPKTPVAAIASEMSDHSASSMASARPPSMPSITWE